MPATFAMVGGMDCIKMVIRHFCRFSCLVLVSSLLCRYSRCQEAKITPKPS